MKVIQVRSLNHLKAIEKGIIIAPNRDFARILVEAITPPDEWKKWKNRAESYFNDGECFAVRVGISFGSSGIIGYDRASYYLEYYDTTYSTCNIYMLNYALKSFPLGKQYEPSYIGGDFVKISNELRRRKVYDRTCMCTDDMISMKGKVGIIKKSYTGSNGLRYFIEQSERVWSPSMINEVVFVDARKPAEIPYTMDYQD